MKKNLLITGLCILCFMILSLLNSAFSQNTGIGTTTPAFKLDVKNGSINTDSAYRIGGEKVLSVNVNLQNTFIGIGADSSITTGYLNTAVGYKTLYSNTTGYRNTANGSEALYFISDGGENTAVGYQAMLSSISAYYNTVIGAYALKSNTTGSYNTANGNFALYENTTGSNNTANGYNTLNSNTTGSGNTAIGNGALFANTTGANNTAVGQIANVLSGALNNATAIGYQANADASNKVRIGNTLVTSIGGQVGWTTFSDGRYKQNVQEDVPGISFINKLHPVTYTVDIENLDKNYYKINPEKSMAVNTPCRHTGFIAQEVESSAASHGFAFSGVDKPQNPGGLYGLRYAEFVVPLVKAVQEQQQIIEKQQKQIDELKKRLEAVEKKN